jgi:hypothetical protein
MMCPTTEGATIPIEGETPTASRDTPYVSASGASLRQSVLTDIAQILSAPFDSVPKIHLWI